jgi:C4-dicarboxylate transporter DctM subunit
VSDITIGIIGVVIMVILLFSKLWVGLGMMIVGFIGCWMIADLNTAISVLGVVPYSQTMNYTMTCMPMFVMMGVVLSISGLGNDLYHCAAKWFGRIRGSLAMATVVACGFFAAVCGDSVVTAVTMGKVSYPAMKEHKYSTRIAVGAIACGGTVGVMIPPSLCFIIYGLITENSIGTLFMAGIIPGITQVLLYIVTIVILAKVKPSLVPAGQKVPMSEKMRSSKNVWPVAVIFIILLWGMYGGWFTPTEAGAFGAFCSIVISYANGGLRGKTRAAMFETLRSAAMVYFLIVGAYVFLRFMALTRLPAEFSGFITTLHSEHGISGTWIMIGLIIMYIILGCFLDVMACLLLTLGIVYPVVTALGYDPIWFGVIVVRLMEIGMVTPPFGLNLFAISKSTGAGTTEVYRGVIPFLLADVVDVFLLMAFPMISLWIPSLM